MTKLEELEEKIAANQKEAKDSRDAVKLLMYEAVVAAQAAHGVDDVRAIQGKHAFVIVKTPHQATFRKYVDCKDPTSEDMISFVRPCLVELETEAFYKILDREPGMLVPVANAVLALAGALSKDFLAPRKG